MQNKGRRMATKNLAAQLRAAKLHIANLEERNEELQKQWTAELTARSRDSRELELAYAQGIKFKGVIEYLEEKLKDA
jgi:protein subunit release factor B